MAQHLPRPHHSAERWLRRLDRAAGRMNPPLTVLAIGLTLLNLTCLALLASRLPITHGRIGLTACASPPSDSSGTSLPPTGDIKAWGY